MGWSSGEAHTDVNEPATLSWSALAISLAPGGPMLSPLASMEAILLSLLLQTPAKMAPQPSSPRRLYLRLRPPSPIAVSEVWTLRASAIAMTPSAV